MKKFLKEHPDCSWKYAPRNGEQQYKYCVLHDAPCASNSRHLSVLSVVKALCSEYSMLLQPTLGWGSETPTVPFAIPMGLPHTAWKKPKLWHLCQSFWMWAQVFQIQTCTYKDSPSILISRSPLGHNLKTQVSNCTSNTPKWHSSVVLIYITFTGTLLSVISLCCLIYIYLCFKELRNLPRKCLISLSVALLFYQAIFLGTAKSHDVASLCKAVAIFLHLFLLAAFSWMSVLAFDTASTFTVKD